MKVILNRKETLSLLKYTRCIPNQLKWNKLIIFFKTI